MKQNQLFNDVTTNSDLLDVVLENSDRLFKSSSNDIIANYLYSLHNLIDKDDERLVSYAHAVDKDFSMGTRNLNTMHKIPVLLAGVVYLDKYRSDVENLTDGELGVLSSISRFDDIDSYEENMKLYNKDILEAIYNKSNDFMVRFDLLCLVEDKFYEFDIKEDDINLVSFQKKMAKFVGTMTNDEYLDNIREYDKKVEEKMNGMKF